MANYTYKSMQVKIDSSTGKLTEITGSVNQASLQAALDIIEDTVLSDGQRSYLPGAAGATITLNGWMNSTTEPIIGGLSNRTSITKTTWLYNGAKWIGGEALPTSVQTSGSVNSLIAWSMSLTFDGSLTRQGTTPT